MAEIEVDSSIALQSDDAEQYNDGEVNISSSDLELTDDGGDGQGSIGQTIGLRFTDLGIPPGATITAAYIQFTADEDQSEATSLTIHAQDSDTTSTFTTTDDDISDRDLTTESVSWTPGEWTTEGDSNAERLDSKTTHCNLLQRAIEFACYVSR